MRIMHLLNTGKFSGAENVVCQIIDLMKYDVECVYCSLDGSIRGALEKKCITFEPISTMSIREVKRVIKRVKPDVIHAHDMRASFFAARACGIIPLVCHIHNNAYDSRKVNLKSILFLFAALKAKHIFWVSNTALSGYCFHHLLRKKSTILLNVINVKKIYEKMNEDMQRYPYDIIYLGRLTFQKNPERLINVLRDLRNLCPHYKAAVVGDGPLKEKVKDLIKEYELDENVSMLGFQSNPLKILHDSKVMLLVSRWEGLPMCVLESLALGVPVISTPTDGIDLVVKDGVNGFICENDETILKSMFSLLNDSVLQKRMSEKCFEMSQVYNNLDVYKTSLQSVYTKD